MRKKRIMGIIAAATLSVSAFSTNVFAESATTVGGAGTTVSGTVNEVTNPSIEVVLPTDLNFGIDAMQMKKDNTEQIVSTGYAILNKSNIPVNVSVKAKVESENGKNVEVKTDKESINTADNKNTTKELYMAVNVAKDLNGVTFDDSTADVDASTVTYKNDAEGATIPLGKDDTSFEFVLNKGTLEDNGDFKALVADSVAAFNFQGAANPYATWAKNDAKVTAVFTINAVSPDLYTSLASSKVEGTHQLYQFAPAIGFAKATMSVEKTADIKTAPTDDITAKLTLENEDTINTVKVKINGAATATSMTKATSVGAATGDWFYDASTSTLTLKKVGTNVKKICGTETTDSNTTDVEVTTKAGKTYTLKLTVQ